MARLLLLHHLKLNLILNFSWVFKIDPVTSVLLFDCAYAIRVTLSSQHNFGFLDSIITNLVPTCLKNNWVTIHRMLVSMILNTIDLEDEHVRGITQVKKEKPKILGFTEYTEGCNKGQADRIDKSTLLCTHCHRKGHEMATYFDLHGRLDWWLKKYKKLEMKRNDRGGKTSVASSMQ
ncbi:hypothetical protein PVK06_039452 [Gossypium arboreum]|uniref:Uncharacterized protein n=1 Tax=Gossypium arboreum TaxID=29729 RepID=A0ABR0N348_GOSAR|nr:hypothetical protein PVK06_039452 [Gossypium arboreum]